MNTYTHFNQKQNIHRGDVFYVNLGNGDGTSMQHGVRPAVIVSNEACNKHSSIITICAISSKVNSKAKIPTHVYLSKNKNKLSMDSICLCEQPISIPRTELREYVTTISVGDMERISSALKIQLAL